MSRTVELPDNVYVALREEADANGMTPAENTLTVEHAEEPLSAYEVAYDAEGGRGGSGRLLEVKKATLFETPFAPGQMRLFGLAETLGENGWLTRPSGWRTTPSGGRVARVCSSRRSSRTRRRGDEAARPRPVEVPLPQPSPERCA